MSNLVDLGIKNPKALHEIKNQVSQENSKQISKKDHTAELAEILFITSYPPRECGIATYSQDLIKALNNKFSSSLSIKVCAWNPEMHFNYPEEVKYTTGNFSCAEYQKLAKSINQDSSIKIVLIQHEFGFFQNQEQAFPAIYLRTYKACCHCFSYSSANPDEHVKIKSKNYCSCLRIDYRNDS